MATLELIGTSFIPWRDWGELSFPPSLSWLAVDFSYLSVNPDIRSYVLFRRSFFIGGKTLYDDENRIYPSNDAFFYHYQPIPIITTTTTRCNMQFRKFPQFRSDRLPDEDYSINFYEIKYD